MSDSKLIKILIVTNILTLISSGVVLYLIQSNDLAIIQPQIRTQDFADNEVGYTPDDSPLMAYQPVSYSGVIKKEKIPEEYALGDYWYVFYFDTPQLLESGMGQQYEKTIIVQASTIDSLEPYLNLEVTIEGRLSTGYAESPMVLIDRVEVK